MPSFLRAFKDRILSGDRSDTPFSAGVEAWKKYEETHKLQDLTEAVRSHQVALDIRVSGHPHRSESLFCTARALWAYCELVADVTKEYSSTVIAYYDEALRFYPDKPSKLGRRATIYTNLGMIYYTLFRLGIEDPKAFPATGVNIGKAIENYRSALQLRRATNDPDRPSSLINLCVALGQKGRKDDLIGVIINLREAIELCTTKPTRRNLLLLSLNHLAQAYDGHQYDSEDITHVVGKVDDLALGLTEDGKGWRVPLVNLMKALWRLCEIEPNRRNDLDEGVLRGREALKLSDGSDKISHAKALITLADVLSARYVQTSPKYVMDLDQAIQYYREAFDTDPKAGSNPILCSSLASAIYIRCQDCKEVEGATLEDAISYYQKALQTCPKDDPLYLRLKDNLGGVYITRFDKLGAEGDLVKGIQAYEDAVSHCPDGNIDVLYYQETLKNLKRALQEQESETWKVSFNTKSKLRRRRSVTGSLRSKQSSDESCPSRPASIMETD